MSCIVLHRKFTGLIVLITMVIAISSCNNSMVNSPDNTPGSQLRGTVRLVLEDNSYEIFKNGVTITVLGTGFATESDSTGKWALNLIPKGTYTLLFKKNGFTDYKRFKVISDGINPVIVAPVILAQTPSFTVSKISTLVPVNADDISITCSVSKISQQTRRVILFFDTTNTSFINPVNHIWTSLSLLIQPNTDTGSLSIPVNTLKSQGFTSGSIVYIAAYGIGRFEATPDESFVSLDPTSGKSCFWNISAPAATANFIIP